jgi:hypothetical protein
VKRNRCFTLAGAILGIAGLLFGCGTGNKLVKDKKAMAEFYRPVIMEKTGDDQRPDWTTKNTFLEKSGGFIFSGGYLGGQDYALTLRMAKAEATKNLLESIQILARSEFSEALHGNNRNPDDLGRYITDAVAWTIENLAISGIKQRQVYYEQILDPETRTVKYNVWIQLEIEKTDYTRAQVMAAQRLLNHAIREKDEQTKETALELLEKLQNKT